MGVRIRVPILLRRSRHSSSSNSIVVGLTQRVDDCVELAWRIRIIVGSGIGIVAGEVGLDLTAGHRRNVAFLHKTLKALVLSLFFGKEWSLRTMINDGTAKSQQLFEGSLFRRLC